MHTKWNKLTSENTTLVFGRNKELLIHGTLARTEKQTCTFKLTIPTA